MGLSRSERLVLSLLAAGILAGRFVRDRVDRPEEVLLSGGAVGHGVPAAPSGALDGSGAPADSAPPADSARDAAPAGPIDLNAAGVDELVRLPGIGPAKARAIVEWRARNGPFASVREVLKVPGIGEKTAARIESLVVVTRVPAGRGDDR